MRHHEYPNATTSSSLHSRWVVWISVAMVSVFASTFCGCLSKPPLNAQTFSFNAPGPSATNAAAGNLVLGLKSLQITPPFDGRLFVYRTGEFSFERDSYAKFLDSPDKDVIAPVCGLLREQNCFSAVVEPGSTVKPDVLVEITIDQLFGDIRRPDSPRAVLAMQVTFWDATNGLSGKVIVQRNYSRSIPMNSTSPSALIEGWNRALVGILAEATSDLRSREIEGQGDDRNADDLKQKSPDKP